MPPCAATVCERVGNTLDSTATFSPASASCQRRAHPGTARADHHYVKLSSGNRHLVYAPRQNLNRPRRVYHQGQDHRRVQRQPQPDRP